ncbi:MAG TPA: hypothetical protein VE377_18325 [Candidatus Dormibacteraeota bacterium]|nr:hypothetical protein [Candidatus Dormibacteraeota bacterium]
MTNTTEMNLNYKNRRGLRATSATFCFALLISLVPAFAQDGSEGIDNGAYHYQGSFELGYRFVNNLGSSAVYDTFVNQHQGPRLLDETLNMRSLNHQGLLFDNLFLSSFGWGGDPENSGRLRMSKDKWYDFNATFRRDRNFFDYNSLANPLNPANPYVQVNDSPHEFQTVRRMYDYSLTIAPQSPVRVRLGYTRNNMEGPAFSTTHQGTEAMLFQNTRTLLDAYQAGVDFKILPRTSISYDQFLQYYKGDTSWTDQNLAFQLAGGTPVDPGISYNPAASQPCAAPVLDGTTTPPTMNPACNGFRSYNRWAPVRVSYPTEQLTVQSRYFRNLDLSARASYSSSPSDVSNWYEHFAGLATRTRERDGQISGPSSAKRIVGNADFGATIHVTEKLRFIDSFRFSNFRIPGQWNLTTTQLFAATLLSTPNVFNPATCPPPFTAATCPQHSASSGADITQDQRFDFLRQNSKLNTFELEYDFTRRFTGHLGYRYESREINHNFSDFQNLTFYPSLATRGPCASVTLVNGVCFTTAASSDAETIDVHAHSVLAGLSARPTDALRASFDIELFSADNAPTRISPRNLQHYKGRINYKPRKWLDLSGTVNVLESRDNVPEILHREHNRNYGFVASMNPISRFGAEFGYNYDDVFSTTNICYVLTSTPPVNSTLCSGGAPYFSAISLYTNKINFGYANLMFKPQPRVTARVGYNLTSTSGSTPTLADPTILTSLGFNYHKPTASLDVELAKGLSWRTAWGYYDYNEKYLPTPLLARDFQSNAVTLSLRYDF